MILQSDGPDDYPKGGEILAQIGWVLAVHLVLASAIVHAVQALSLG